MEQKRIMDSLKALAASPGTEDADDALICGISTMLLAHFQETGYTTPARVFHFLDKLLYVFLHTVHANVAGGFDQEQLECMAGALEEELGYSTAECFRKMADELARQKG